MNKTFRRHSMEYPENKNINAVLNDGGNAVLPVSEKEFSVADRLTDTLDKGHRLILYTTMKEEEQVVFSGSVGKTVKAGGSLQITVDKVYGTNDNTVAWSVYSCVLPDGTALYSESGADMSAAGTVNQNGKYSAVGVQSGTEVAVKAVTADGSAYGIAYIKIE